MKNLLFIFFGLFILSLSAIGQNIPFESTSFPHEKEQFKEALEHYRAGDDLFEKGWFFGALNEYLDARRFNAENALLNYKIGICYLNLPERYKCLHYFEKAFELDRMVSDDIHFYLARGYHLNSAFEIAVNEYKLYLSELNKEKRAEAKDEIIRFISQCEVGISLLKNQERVIIDHLPDPVNSTYNDHSPFISADESMIYFTSTRKNKNKQERDGQYDEDIYLSYKNFKSWFSPESIGETVNTPHNDATVGLSPDGEKLLIYNGNKGGGDIEICWKEGDEWIYPRSLPKTVNSEYKESSACFSPDGQKIYFVSNRPGGQGGSDIYVTEKDIKGRWLPAKNLGPIINSAYDEETVFVHPNGKTLYFSANNKRSMGGFDIFMSKLDENSKWGAPENLGSPINSPDDDLCFVISASGKHGYFSSVRLNSVGGLDIYQVIFLGPDKPLIFTSENHLLISDSLPTSDMFVEQYNESANEKLSIYKGTVVDDSSGQPLNAQMLVQNISINTLHQSQLVNNSQGRFLFVLPPFQNYGITVTKEGYLPYSEHLKMDQNQIYQEINRNIRLKKIDNLSVAPLNNIMFQENTAYLKPNTLFEIKQMAIFLSQHPEINAELIFVQPPEGSVSDDLLTERAKKIISLLRMNGFKPSTVNYQVVKENELQKAQHNSNSSIFLRLYF